MWPPGFSAIGLIVVVFLGVRLGRRLVYVAKDRLTYPRTGQVIYRQPCRYRRKLIAAIVAAVVVGAAVAFGLRGTLPLDWIPLVDGTLIAAFLVYLAYAQELKRFYLLAIASFAIGAAGALLRMGDIGGSALYFGLMGWALIISGGATLWLYLRQPSPPGEA